MTCPYHSDGARNQTQGWPADPGPTPRALTVAPGPVSDPLCSSASVMLLDEKSQDPFLLLSLPAQACPGLSEVLLVCHFPVVSGGGIPTQAQPRKSPVVRSPEGQFGGSRPAPSAHSKPFTAWQHPPCWHTQTRPHCMPSKLVTGGELGRVYRLMFFPPCVSTVSQEPPVEQAAILRGMSPRGNGAGAVSGAQ